MKKIITAFALMLSAAFANAQANQETIVYNMTVENSPAAMLLSGAQLKLYHQNNMSLTELTSPAFSMTTLVTDTGTLTLINVMGQKQYLTIPASALPSKGGDSASGIIYIDSTRQIAGYACKKALVKISGKDTGVFWYTEKLPIAAFGKMAEAFKGLKGMPLEYQVNLPQMKLTLSAQSVSTDAIPASKFKLSTDGYSKLDPAMAGMMQF